VAPCAARGRGEPDTPARLAQAKAIVARNVRDFRASTLPAYSRVPAVALRIAVRNTLHLPLDVWASITHNPQRETLSATALVRWGLVVGASLYLRAQRGFR
jgi:hypothetical protein